MQGVLWEDHLGPGKGNRILRNERKTCNPKDEEAATGTNSQRARESNEPFLGAAVIS